MGKYRFAEMIWNEIRDAAQAGKVAVLPVATYEDHGPHLPVDTDVVLCTGICERAVAQIPDEAVLVPAIPHGYSPHHMDFPGTLTIEGVNVDGVEKVALLGFENTLHFEKTGPSNLTVTIPEQARSNPPCAFAWTFVMRR